MGLSHFAYDIYTHFCKRVSAAASYVVGDAFISPLSDSSRGCRIDDREREVNRSFHDESSLLPFTYVGMESVCSIGACTQPLERE